MKINLKFWNSKRSTSNEKLKRWKIYSKYTANLDSNLVLNKTEDKSKQESKESEQQGQQQQSIDWMIITWNFTRQQEEEEEEVKGQEQTQHVVVKVLFYLIK